MFKIVMEFRERFRVFNQDWIVLDHVFTRIRGSIIIVNGGISARIVNYAARMDIWTCIRDDIPLITSRLLTLYRVSTFRFSHEVLIRTFRQPFSATRAFSIVRGFRNLFGLNVIVIRRTSEGGHRRNKRVPARPTQGN